MASNGSQGVFARDAWTSPVRTPLLFPDAVTLIPLPKIADLLRRIDSSAGCTIKDSYASLDLEPHGFRVLFDAQWIMAPTHTAKILAVPKEWTTITRDHLELWESAWSHEGGPRNHFQPSLLSDEVVVLGRLRKDRMVAGGILSRSTGVVGISNVFAEDDLAAQTWSDLANSAHTLFPGLPLISYESGEALEATQLGGFEAAGPLRVWIAGA